MSDLSTNPAFTVYTLCSSLLILNLLGLWAYSGAVRGKEKSVPNPEDVTTVSKGSTVSEVNPPGVARVLRAHGNAMANSIPFLFLGLLFVLQGGSGTEAWVFFGLFTLFRWAHTLTYLNEVQPWRTVSFALGLLTSLGLLIRVLILTFAHPVVLY